MHNRKEGIKVAIAPLLTDIPIVAVTFLILSRLQAFEVLTGIVSLCGAAFIFYLAYDTYLSSRRTPALTDVSANSYQKGVLVNFLSPHPYLFWLLVGAPLITEAGENSTIAQVVFIVCFYLFLVGSKIIIAYVTDKSKQLLSSKYYLYLLRFLAIILVLFGIKLIYDGLAMI